MSEEMQDTLHAVCSTQEGLVLHSTDADKSLLRRVHITADSHSVLKTLTGEISNILRWKTLEIS